MQAIKALTPIVRKLGPKANPANLKLPRAAIAAWAFYIGQSVAPKLATAHPITFPRFAAWQQQCGSWSCLWQMLLPCMAELGALVSCLLWKIACMLAGYISLVLFSSSLPGRPAYAVEWRTLVETWHCSINFFYVNQVLNWLGVHLIESVPVSFTSCALVPHSSQLDCYVCYRLHSCLLLFLLLTDELCLCLRVP